MGKFINELKWKIYTKTVDNIIMLTNFPEISHNINNIHNAVKHL